MTPPPPNLIGTKLGNYRLERVLGQGRMGVVYLARDEALLRPTAVKILAWSFPEPAGYDAEAWFLAEARHVARVNHPSVIQVYSVARHGSRCYIAMEYVDGVAADRLALKGPFAPVRATETILQIAGALEAAHACGVVHRDVKPANILIREDGTAKLGDFGMALDVRAGAVGGARAHDRVGTPYYTAPEIWKLQPASPATDLYSLGATYYFLLTGRPPFDAQDLPGIMAAHQNAAPPDPRSFVPGLAPEVVSLIHRCLAKSPSERFESAQALAWELRGLLRILGSPNRPALPLPSVPPPLEKVIRKPTAWISALGLSRSRFTEFTKQCPLQRFEPFASVGRALSEILLSAPGTTVLLTGEPGSGKSPLVRGVLGEPQWQLSHVAWLQAEGAASAGSLARQVCRAFGAVSNAYTPKGGDLEGLLDYLERSSKVAAGPAVLVIDDLDVTKDIAAQLSNLARAAWATRYFSLVVLAPTNSLEPLSRALGPVVGDASRALTLPPLDARQMLHYLSGMVESARLPGEPLLLLTPDAALIVAHRSQGNLAVAHSMVERMLKAAARQGTQVLTSWEAWNAAEVDPGAACEDLARRGSSSQRPDRWPPPEILELLNAGRAAIGMPGRKEHSSESER